MEVPDTFHLVISMEILLTLLVAAVIPTLLFWWKLHAVAKKTHDMHMDPDRHGFGTGDTNTLLSQHMDDEQEMHAKSIDATRYLTHTIRELTHYVKWLSKEQVGKSPPPYIRSGDDPLA